MKPEEQIGYLIAKVEDMANDVKEMKARITKIEEELNLYKNIVRFVKLLGYSILFLLAFKFGDVKSLWTGGK